MPLQAAQCPAAVSRSRTVGNDCGWLPLGIRQLAIGTSAVQYASSFLQVPWRPIATYLDGLPTGLVMWHCLPQERALGNTCAKRRTAAPCSLVSAVQRFWQAAGALLAFQVE